MTAARQLEVLDPGRLRRDPLVADVLGRCSFPAPMAPGGSGGVSVACAVSGGADSLSLLILARAAGLEATAVHVDHGLRPGSAQEAQVVWAAARRLGAAFSARRVSVPDGPNLEARAREARYAALPPGVLTGHTADDQAETVLVNLLRGAGLDGLSGMRPPDLGRSGRPDGGRRGSPVRPLLALRRHETADLCRHLGFEPVADPSNADPRFLRTRVRQELVPLLAELSGRDPVPVLCRQAALMAGEAELLDELAAGLDPTDARALTAAPPPLARRAIRAWLRDCGPHPPSAADVERILSVARGDAVACEISGGRRVARSGGRLGHS